MRGRIALLISLAFVAATGTVFSQGDRARPRSIDPRDALLAALGTATIECLGTVGPSTFTITAGVLARAFTECRSRDARALEAVDALIAVQFSAQGQRDDLSGHFVSRWNAFDQAFPDRREAACPTWTLENVIDAPTIESVPRSMNPLRIGKEGYRYRVSSPLCPKDGECAVRRAAACSAGFGPEFLVDRDAKNSRVEVDPMWWLTRYTFPPDPGANPFKAPGYYHAMSYYGDLPGALYGAIQREGEACSEYLDGKHYTDRKLVALDCGGGWKCMTYCTFVPPQP